MGSVLGWLGCCWGTKDSYVSFTQMTYEESTSTKSGEDSGRGRDAGNLRKLGAASYCPGSTSHHPRPSPPSRPNLRDRTPPIRGSRSKMSISSLPSFRQALNCGLTLAMVSCGRSGVSDRSAHQSNQKATVLGGLKFQFVHATFHSSWVWANTSSCMFPSSVPAFQLLRLRQRTATRNSTGNHDCSAAGGVSRLAAETRGKLMDHPASASAVERCERSEATAQRMRSAAQRGHVNFHRLTTLELLPLRGAPLLEVVR
jgi:hypothetical protein